MSLLGIDIGSGTCKGVVFTKKGKELARHHLSYSAINTAAGGYELNPKIFREAVFTIIQTLSRKVKKHPIRALAISSHGETIVPVDEYGRSTGNAIMNSDNRALEEVEWWSSTLGKEKIYGITGLPLHSMFSLNKILWVRKNDPDLFNRTSKFLSVGDFILTQLGLPPYTDYSLACRTMAFDISRLEWSAELLEHCGLAKDKLGIPVPSGTIAGTLSSDIAAELGLSKDTVVAVGGHDQPCGALGAGVINDLEVFDSAGTYECMALVTATPMNNRKALLSSLNSYCHVVPGKFVTLAFFPAGMATSWFIEQCCFEDKEIARRKKRSVFAVLDEKVLEHCPGVSGLTITPHFAGSCNPHWDPRATGIIAGLTPGKTRYHVFKGLFEGIACELAVNTNVLDEITGGFTFMRIAGGNARLAFTVQLRADITGKQIEVLRIDEASALGAAMLAGIAVGIFLDAADAVKKCVRVESVVLPDSESSKIYEHQYRQYTSIYSALAPFREL